MPSRRDRTRSSERNVPSILSIAFGLLGLALLPVLFPDPSLILGILALAFGVNGTIRSKEVGGARVEPLVGILLGLVLVAIALISVVFGNAGTSGGGRAIG